MLPKFQNHFMMMALFQALMILGGLIYPQHRIMTAYIDKLEARVEQPATLGGSQGGSTMAPADVQDLVLIRNSSTLYSSVFIFLTCLIFGFYASHRLGGPIFKTIRYLREYREGKSLPKLDFRKGDFFHELADEINQALKKKDK